jgi:tRNA G18 (ribose-2'-O)-methylase SpoU
MADINFKDKTVKELVKKFIVRSITSSKKHGNTIDQVKKPNIKWVEEALEEAMDLCVYLQRLHDKLKKES